MTEKKLGSDSMYPTKKQVYCGENSTGIQLKDPSTGRLVPHNSKPIYREEISHGISQRLYIATMAMQGLIISSPGGFGAIERNTTKAYQYADELLKKENL